jgi:SAM-dependent methyltransferase
MKKFWKYQIPYHLDSPQRTLFHKQIIKKKPFLRKLYEEWYQELTDLKPILPSGKMVELGSGGGFLKEIDPTIICSDIIDLPSNDLTFSALEMPFSNNELSALFMIDTFHHIPDSALFLNEAKRVLKKDGMLVMIEPANSLWGRFIYKNFHHEPFEPAAGWNIPAAGPLSGANGALPWIVFERDRKIFESKYPSLQILEIKHHTPLRYLLSGGVSYKQMVPGFSYPFFSWLDKTIPLFSRQLSMFVTLKIKKINT